MPLFSPEETEKLIALGLYPDISYQEETLERAQLFPGEIERRIEAGLKTVEILKEETVYQRSQTDPILSEAKKLKKEYPEEVDYMKYILAGGAILLMVL